VIAGQVNGRVAAGTVRMASDSLSDQPMPGRAVTAGGAAAAPSLGVRAAALVVGLAVEAEADESHALFFG
jgi:hypothetical protein